MTPPVHYRTGDLWGLSVMKFTLTYEGPLPASGNKPKPAEVWRIRDDFHPQLADLWDNHPALKDVLARRKWPLGSGSIVLHSAHHSERRHSPVAATPSSATSLDLCAPIEKYGAYFRPLVRETFALHCGLKILFLRKELPGRVYQGGDLDGRIKTIVDALTMPQHKEQVFADASSPNPILCLMEDDSMLSGLDVQSERLLTGQNFSRDHVKLVVEVDVRVRQAAAYNQSFLG